MAETTAIEWCDATFNPWMGCTKVSPACDHCYAARQDAHRKWTPEGWGGPRRRTSAELWKGPAKWNAQPFAECMGCGWRGETREAALRDSLPGFDRDPGAMRCCPKCDEPLLKEARRRVFCASLADVFDNEVDPAWRDELMGLIVSTPNLDWLLLTKRIGNVAKMLKPDAWQHLPNVWLGATVVTQEEADRDVPKLLAVPARVRFLSIEPMLGPITLPPMRCDHGSLPGPGGAGGVTCPDCRGHGDRGASGCMRLHWVICGGESGPGARPMHPDWARSLRDQCAAAGVPFLFKQWGEWLPSEAEDQPVYRGEHRHLGGHVHTYRIGKAAAGRMLDGRTHDEFPLGTGQEQSLARRPSRPQRVHCKSLTPARTRPRAAAPGRAAPCRRR